MSADFWNEIEHFKKAEFDCPCCGANKMARDFVRKLDDLRSRVNFPLVVSSGYRCAKHNAAVSKTGDHGPHTTGRAVDFAIFGRAAFIVVQQWSLGGWGTGLGLNQRGPHQKRFVHLDDLEAGERYRPTVWTY